MATASTTLPAADVPSLKAWIDGLDDSDYRWTSRAHVGLGTRPEGGVLTVERFPGLVVLNRHEHVDVCDSALVMTWPTSTAYLLGVVPIGLAVTWRMDARRHDDGVELTGSLEVTVRSRALEAVGRTLGLGRLLAAHARDELDGFAADMLRKAPAPATAAPEDAARR